MEKIFLLVVFFTITLFGVSNANVGDNKVSNDANSKADSSGDCWSVYEYGITNDDYALSIRYDNYCGQQIRVRVTYEIRYRPRYCDNDWASEDKTIECVLQNNRSNYPLAGFYGSLTYDECTTRYRLKSVDPIE